MAATEAFVKEQIKEAEERCKEEIREEKRHSKVELAKLKDEIEAIQVSLSKNGVFKDKRNQIELYKD